MANQVVIDHELQNKATTILEGVNLNQPGALSIGKLRTITDARVNKQQSQGLDLPGSYSAPNALTQAFLRLQTIKNSNKQPVLQACTPTSIIQALMDMVVQGLSPAKNQCYFIAYGNELQMQRSYFGTAAALLRLDNIVDIDTQDIHEGDQVSTMIDEHGHLVLDTDNTHIDWMNQDKDLIGAYAIISTSDGIDHLTIMTKKQIEVSWSQSKTHNVQNKFGTEMAKRTVLNRAAKMYVNTSDDSDLLTAAINNTTSNEFDDEPRDVTPTKEEQTTQELLDGFEKSQAELAKKEEPADDHSSSAEGEQEELFKDGTITPDPAKVNA